MTDDDSMLYTYKHVQNLKHIRALKFKSIYWFIIKTHIAQIIQLFCQILAALRRFHQQGSPARGVSTDSFAIGSID